MCNHCIDNFIVKSTSNEISWQGKTYQDLDICLNDSLTYVNNIILDKISLILKGKNIVFNTIDFNLDDCDYLKDILSTDEMNLINILKTYKTGICNLQQDIVDINSDLDFLDTTEYNLGCLPPLDVCGNAYNFKILIQAIITKLCALSTQFGTIATTILDIIEDATGNFISTGVTSCGGNGINITGTGASTVIKFQALVPPNCPIIYTGSTSYFDITGIGKPNTAYCGWYICNGSNGTPNSNTLPQNGSNTITYIVRFT